MQCKFKSGLGNEVGGGITTLFQFTLISLAAEEYIDVRQGDKK